MKIEFYNCPEPQIFDAALLPEAPAFLSYQPDFKAMTELAEQYKSFENILVIGHGGSITSFYGMYHALREQSTKHAYALSTIDPDYIANLKTFLTPENTLVIAISKSGETVTQIEALMQFADFPVLAVTAQVGPLADIASKMNWKIVPHPPIGGRYTGLTEVALLPAALCGLDVQSIFKSAQKVYQNFNKTNDAFNAASILNQLEQKGIADVFMPIYDSQLFGFSNLIVQLCHESFGKDGKGQTYFAHHAPESQHHTNQRFFGGQKNIAGWFISSKKSLQDVNTKIPDAIKDVHVKDHPLSALDAIPLSFALHAEREATIEDARLQNIPVINQTISQRTPAEVGELTAFWQLYAIYASALRGVNPFDQPQVENSKKISFAKRLQHKGIL